MKQHETLRVPQGWVGQDKTLVIQLERILTDLYNLLGTNEGEMVTNVSYGDKKLTVTINGQDSTVVTIETIKTDLELTKTDVGLGNVENKSVAQIKSSLGSFTWGALAGR